MSHIVPLEALRRGDIDTAGGKASNLGELLAAGVNVPPGFCIRTSAYRQFVDSAGLEPRGGEAVGGVRAEDTAGLEAASAAIRGAFRASAMPEAVASEAAAEYAALGEGPVAVRSSATAEDLPDLSFAGQQDTYLNVVGVSALLRAVADCWSSLWTARAIGYRRAHGIPSDGIALAVVVQRMVQSVASGVLFTANPLTGARTQTVVDATVGLGEALVSGRVEPDHFVVQDGRIIERSLGAKNVSVRGVAGGGTRLVEEAPGIRQALPDETVLELARLGGRIQDHFGSPQDIEWAVSPEGVFIVQSRPITSLYPLPERVSDERLLALFSFGAWQGMLDPFTPLGADSFHLMMTGFARLFGMEMSVENETALVEAGSRLFLNLTSLFRSPFGRRFLGVYADALDPGCHDAMRRLLADPRFSTPRRRITPRTLAGFLRIARWVVPTVAFNMRSPVRGRMRLQDALQRLADEVEGRYARASTLSDQITALEKTLADLPPWFFRWGVPCVASGQIPMQALLRMSAALPDGPRTMLEITRGMEHNVTTEMDLRLWRASQVIAVDPAAARCLDECPAESLSRSFLDGALPRALQDAVGGFMQRYGTRGVAEIDMGRPRWREDPTPLFQALKSYCRIAPDGKSPETVFENGRASARQAAERLSSQLAATRGGGIKARVARILIRRLRELGGMREGPKLAAVKADSAGREAFLASGRLLVEAGILGAADDIFFLRLRELREIAAGVAESRAALVRERRRQYDREMRRRLVPRVMLSDGTAFYEGVASQDGDGGAGAAEDAGIIRGSPVSPGVAEGMVRVVLDPFTAHIEPGEILVCPATDPAWTPLFLPAAGLVMEVGGMMTHGSVVAREYGIPAVVGVSGATTRLRTGERVRVDGSTGVIRKLGVQTQ